MKLNKKPPKSNEKIRKRTRKAEELLIRTTIQGYKKCCSLEANYKDFKNGLKLVQTLKT